MKQYLKTIRKGAIHGLCYVLACTFVTLAIAQVATYTSFAQLPSNPVPGTISFVSNGLFARYNISSSVFSYFGPIFPTTAPPTAGWTTDNGGTFDTTYGYPYYSHARAGSVQIGVVYRTAPATPYTCTALIYHDIGGAPPNTSGSGTTAGYGLAFRDGTGKILDILLNMNTGTAQIQADHWTTSTSLSSTPLTYGPANAITDLVVRNPAWLAIQDDSTNLNLYWSIDKNHLKAFYTETRTSFFGSSGPTQVGFESYFNLDAVELAVPSWNCQ